MKINKDKTETVAVVDLGDQRERLINEKKAKQEKNLQDRFQKAMGWNKKTPKNKSNKKNKNKNKKNR